MVRHERTTSIMKGVPHITTFPDHEGSVPVLGFGCFVKQWGAAGQSQGDAARVIKQLYDFTAWVYKSAFLGRRYEIPPSRYDRVCPMATKLQNRVRKAEWLVGAASAVRCS